MLARWQLNPSSSLDRSTFLITFICTHIDVNTSSIAYVHTMKSYIDRSALTYPSGVHCTALVMAVSLKVLPER